jgi:hypothetical protein
MDRATKRELVERLNRDARLIAGRYGLRYRSIKAERANVKNRYGICYSDGSIQIRLRHATSGKPLKYSSLVNTLCHELAHLRHFDHSPRFHAFYLELLAFARSRGIYRPRPQATGGLRAASAAPARPRAQAPTASPGEQLPLFAGF